jgi:hypothetical protein
MNPIESRLDPVARASDEPPPVFPPEPSLVRAAVPAPPAEAPPVQARVEEPSGDLPKKEKDKEKDKDRDKAKDKDKEKDKEKDRDKDNDKKKKKKKKQKKEFERAGPWGALQSPAGLGQGIPGSCGPG